ncbi:hypothetical protein ACROYT_G013730 [Oculina patagonica]
MGDPTKTSQVFLQDFSKYGTSVNGVKISGTVNLKSGDEILFGKNNSYYRLRYSPLIVVTSCLDDKQKKTLKSNIHKLGGHIINDWRQNTVSHLVMDGLTFTIKVIHALAECRPIVKPSYFDDVVKAGSTLPSVERYLPLLKEETISSQDASFLPNEARRTLLKGKTFIFISKKQYKRVHHAVESSGGSTLLRDTPGSEADDSLVSSGVCVMMVDIKEQNTLPAASQHWILHVMETLRRHRCRPIPESELGLALLFTSLDKYCNPSITAVPPLTQSLVSQSFQAADVMSQRAYSQHFTDQETQFKKPPIPARHTKDDRTQGSKCEQEGLASSNIDKPKTTTYFGKRCTSTESVVESLPGSQVVSSVKKRKIMEMETLVTDSMDENKDEAKTQGKLELPVADSIVADSLEVKHDSSSDCDLEPQKRKNELLSKVTNVAESLDINDSSQMTMGESLVCESNGEKPEEQSRLSQQRDTLVKGKGYEESRQNTSNITRSSGQQGASELPRHVPAGFLCSRIPRKASEKCVFEDEAEAQLPRNLVLVDQTSLLVRTVTTTPTVQTAPHNTTTKNFKKFKKQIYPGSCISLPRIIGGSDLTLHQSSDRLDKDEWFLEAREADVERQREERLAEELFRWEERPTKTRRLKR